MLPYATADLPGTGGLLKQEPADFRVRELPLYPALGTGDFLYLRIEKTGLSAEQLTQHLARTLQISRGDIGTAGLKDRHAITEQTVSVPAGCETLLGAIETTAVRLLAVERHRHKLRTGHLAGNEFEILLRTSEPEATTRAERIADRLRLTGIPNYYGDQRFGHDGETLRLGYDLLTGRKTPRDIAPSRRRFLLRLALSAAQSDLFNHLLAARVVDETWRRVLVGDVMQVTASGGLFVAEDLAREQPRLESGEIVITGPMFGPKMRKPVGPAAELEQRLAGERAREVLEGATFANEGINPGEWFRPYAKLAPGTRRPLAVAVPDLTVAAHPDGLLFRVTLPPGCYATTLLREFQKVEASASDSRGEGSDETVGDAATADVTGEDDAASDEEDSGV